MQCEVTIMNTTISSMSNSQKLSDNINMMSYDSIQKTGLETAIVEQVDKIKALTLRLGFSQATLANQYEKKQAFSTKLFNQLEVAALEKESIKLELQEMRLLQAEIKAQLNKVSLLSSQLEDAEAVLTELVLA